MPTIVYQISPEESLHPIVETWLEKRKSAETFLYTREGSNIICLSDRRNSDETTLSILTQMDKKDNPIVQAVDGKFGFYETKDKSGNEVLEYIEPIKGTDWYLAAVINRDELLSEVYFRTKVIIVFVVLLFLLSGFLIIHIFLKEVKNITKNFISMNLR